MPCRKRSEREQLRKDMERDEIKGISLVAFLLFACLVIYSCCLEGGLK